MKRSKRITRKQKKAQYGSEEKWRRARKEELRKEVAVKLNNELNNNPLP
jgi:hypothetical protein